MAQYKDIIFLLGVGASVEAGIPSSGAMIDRIEQLLKDEEEWKQYRTLYYRGIVNLQRDINFPLQLFSLNYDLCVERLNASDFCVETGFPGLGPEFIWDWERFEDLDSGPPAPEIYLYKLHGSINWKRDE